MSESFLRSLSRARKESASVKVHNITPAQIEEAIKEVSHIKGYLSFIQDRMKIEGAATTDLHARLEQARV
jgi:hypothetical protein